MKFCTGAIKHQLAAGYVRGSASKLWMSGLATVLCLAVMTPGAEAKPGIVSDGAAPRAVTAENMEDFEDMRVKVLGGHVRMTRRWTKRGWEWNSRWNPILDYSKQMERRKPQGIRLGSTANETEARIAMLRTYGKGVFKHGVGGGGSRLAMASRQRVGGPSSACGNPPKFYLFRNDQTYRPEKYRPDIRTCIAPDSNVYHAQLRQTITKNDDDYTWRDKKGNLIFYKEGQLEYYEDKNDVRVSLEYEDDHVKYVKDHHGNTIITYHWQKVERQFGEETVYAFLLKKLEDYTGRSVTYRYGEDSNDLLTYLQLLEVVDVRGESWTYQYKTHGTNRRTPESVTDPNGRVTTYSINGDGYINGYETEDGAGVNYSHTVDSQKKVYKVTRRNKSGVITETWHNALGMPIKQTVGGELQYQTEYLYSSNSTAKDLAKQYGYIDAAQHTADVYSAVVRIVNSTTTDARGLKTKKFYDTFRNVTRTENPDGTYTATEWNTELTLPLKERDERGLITEYTYDSKGNLLTLTEAVGTPDQRITRYSYDQYGHKLTQTTGESAAGNTAIATTHWDYDGYGNVTKMTDAEGNTTEYQEFDVNGNAHRIIDGRLKAWTQGYDAVGNPLTDLNPYGQGYTTEYDAAGDLVKITDASGSSLHIVNNASGLPLTVTDDSGNKQELKFDKSNRLVSSTDAEGASIGLEYDSQNRLRAIVDGEDNRTQYAYKENLLAKIQYPTYAEELGYDNRDRISNSKQLANNLEYLSSYGYDLNSNPTSDTDALGNIEKYEYDNLRRLVAIVDPVNGEEKKTEFTYDARDNLLQVKDPEGRLTVYTYDKNDRLKSETKHEFVGTHKQRIYHYDANGNLITVINPQQQKHSYSHDDANRLNKLQVYAHTGNTQPVKVVDYHYNEKAQYTGYTQQPGTDTANATADIVHHRESYSYDKLNRLESVAVDYYGEGEKSTAIAFSKSYSYSYYGNGLKKTYTNPEGITYTYYYNKNNQLAAVHIPGEGQLAWINFNWQAPQTLLLPGGNKITLKYDDFLQVKERILEDSAHNNKATAVYEYDLESNIRKITSDHGDYQFDYDNLYRLKQADYPQQNAANDEQFGYDGVGNRTGQQFGEVVGDTFTSSATTALEYNDHNQLTAATGNHSASFQYNDSGHTIQKVQAGITWDYRYNHEERLIAVAKNGATVGEYQYNPYGQRIRKAAGEVTHFLYNEEGMAAEYDDTGQLIREYHFKPGMPWMTEPLFQRLASGEVYYYQNDHLGTPQRMLEKSGAVVWQAPYTAFGKAEILVVTAENNLRFSGQYYDDESSLHHNYMRDYDPELGRYIQSDPIGLEGGLNTYVYVYNNPIKYIDPTGEYGLAGAGYGAISGGIGGYISGGWQGALAGAGTGALVGAVNPFGANAAGAAAGAGIASLLGQGAGNLVSGNDITDPCNYDFSAAAGAALGGALGGPLGNAVGRYVGPYRFPIIGRPLSAPGISNAPGNTVGSIVEGVSVGAGELAGQQF